MDIIIAGTLADAQTVGLACTAQRSFSEPGTGFVEGLGPGFIAFLDDQEFDGSAGSSATFNTGSADGVRTVVVLGLGDQPDADAIRVAAGLLGRATSKAPSVATDLALLGPTSAVVEGVVMSHYRFDAYKSKATPPSTELFIAVGGDADAVGPAVIAATATLRCRDLINTPPIDQSPEQLTSQVLELADEVGLRVVTYDEDALVEGRFGGVLGVAAGSDRPPRLLEIWHEPENTGGFVALVGKGIIFDSGGLSLKSPANMETMKTDMSGAAVVIAVMEAVARLELPIKVVGITPLTDNMPGGYATKPGDVLRIRNGKTIEVLNTDAEGRLVLADGLSLASEMGPDFIVDIATLTGAAKVALGEKIAAVFGDDDLARRVIEVGAHAGERFWQLPMPADYRKLIDSKIADMKNTAGRYGGASGAALLLAEFVGEGIPWVHLDIAGPARWPENEHYQSEGGSGFAVRTLIALLEATASR
jgi:leucyl aminopeptidase